jgi:hypothetical protein
MLSAETCNALERPGNMIDSACQWIDTDADDIGDACERFDLVTDCTAVSAE